MGFIKNEMNQHSKPLYKTALFIEKQYNESKIDIYHLE